MTNLKFIFLIIFIGFISVFAGLYFGNNLSPSLEPPHTKKFFNSIAKDINNKNISLSQYKKKWLLVNFWV